MVGYAVAGYLSALAAGRLADALSLGVTVGLTVGLVRVVVGACTSFV